MCEKKQTLPPQQKKTTPPKTKINPPARNYAADLLWLFADPCLEAQSLDPVISHLFQKQNTTKKPVSGPNLRSKRHTVRIPSRGEDGEVLLKEKHAVFCIRESRGRLLRCTSPVGPRLRLRFLRLLLCLPLALRRAFRQTVCTCRLLFPRHLATKCLRGMKPRSRKEKRRLPSQEESEAKR